MSDLESSNWSETAASNNATPPNGWPEGMNPSDVNNSARENMGALKREWNRSHPTASSSGINTVTLSYTTAPAAYVQGQRFSFKVGATNTGAATLNVNGLGAKNVFMDGATLGGGEMVVGSVVEVMYDGTQFQITSSRAVTNLQPGFKNWIINGGFDVWQRGAGGSASIAVTASANTYTADRWVLHTGANQASTVSQQAGTYNTGQTRFCARVQRNSGQTGTGSMSFECPLTTDMLVPLRNAIVTISCAARAGANWSPTSGTLSMFFYVGTGTEGQRSGGFTGETTVASVATNITTSPVTISATASAVVPTTTTQGSIIFSWTPTGTAGANDYFEVTEVQLEISPQRTAFDRRPFVDELGRCQRFFQKSFSYATAPAQSAGTTGAFGFTQITGAAAAQNGANVQLVTRMRTTPSVTTYNPSASNAQARNNSVAADCSSTVTGASEVGIQVNVVNAAGSAAGNTNLVHFIADADL